MAVEYLIVASPPQACIYVRAAAAAAATGPSPNTHPHPHPINNTSHMAGQSAQLLLTAAGSAACPSRSALLSFLCVHPATSESLAQPDASPIPAPACSGIPARYRCAAHYTDLHSVKAAAVEAQHPAEVWQARRCRRHCGSTSGALSWGLLDFPSWPSPRPCDKAASNAHHEQQWSGLGPALDRKAHPRHRGIALPQTTLHLFLCNVCMPAPCPWTAVQSGCALAVRTLIAKCCTASRNLAPTCILQHTQLIQASWVRRCACTISTVSSRQNSQAGFRCWHRTLLRPPTRRVTCNQES